MRVTRFVLALAVVALGCDNTTSSTLDNGELRLFASAEIDEYGDLELVAQITTDNPALLEETYVDLVDGDTLWASLAGERVAMSREYIPVLGLVQYRAYFESVVGGEIVTIDLERPDFGDITGSSVRVPEAVELSMPSSFSRSDGLVAQWTAVPATRSRLALAGPCIDDDSFELDGNPGRIELAPPRLAIPDGVDPGSSCELDGTVSIINERAAASGFGRGGRILASQVRSAALEITP